MQKGKGEYSLCRTWKRLERRLLYFVGTVVYF